MAVKLSPIFNEQEFDANGDPLVGGKLYTYAAGSSTPLASYTSSTGSTAQANPIILNSRGEVDNPIWITAGRSYKFALYDVNNVLVRTVDNVTGVNDSSVSIDQWVDSGVVPTYVSATKFTLPGDQTSSFTVNRRIKATVSAGTVYGYISVSAYTDLTTITLVLDSGVLDTGLSAVQLGILTPTNSALPQVSTSQIQDLAVTNAKLAEQYINDLTTVTAVGTDFIAIADTSDSGNKKKALISDIQTVFASNAEYVTGTDTTKALNSAVARERNVVSGTAVSASGTSVDFTGLPSWVKRVTLMVGQISTSGTANLLIQIGDAGGIEDTGYLGDGFTSSGGATANTNYTAGFGIGSGNQAAASISQGSFVLTKLSGNTWVIFGAMGYSSAATISQTAGGKTLSAILDRIRLTTTNGTDSFDAGSVNILYE
jgi:hypothetical protein